MRIKDFQGENILSRAPRDKERPFILHSSYPHSFKRDDADFPHVPRHSCTREGQRCYPTTQNGVLLWNLGTNQMCLARCSTQVNFKPFNPRHINQQFRSYATWSTSANKPRSLRSHPLNTRLLLIRAGMQTDNLAFQQQCQPLQPPVPPCYGWFLHLQPSVVPVQLSAGTDGEQDRRTQLGYPDFLTLSLQGIMLPWSNLTLSPQLCYISNTDTRGRTEQQCKGVRAIQVGSTTVPKKTSPHKTMAPHTHCHHEFNKQWLESALKLQWMLQGTLVWAA